VTAAQQTIGRAHEFEGVLVASAGDVMVLMAALYTLGSVTVPSLASVYNELALKKHMDTSIDLQNW
jgi:hypothetical protein